LKLTNESENENENDRAVWIVRGHQAQAPEAAAAGLTSVVAVVLSTFRRDNPDTVLDHELWLACMEAVATVVGATGSEVQLPPRRGFWAWLRRQRRPRPAGTLAAFMVQLRAGGEADWQTVLWRKDDRVVAVATCEPWYRAGGPGLYHDSYTTAVFLGRQAAARLIPVLQLSVAKAGGVIEGAVDAEMASKGVAAPRG
jgi:hypothetical protein